MADRERKDDDERPLDAEAEASDGTEKKEGASAGERGAEDEDAGDDQAAKRVAEALGVDEEKDREEGADPKPADDKEAEAVPNRALRRREEAMERRRRRKGGAAAKASDEEEPLPKDKNARAKELLKRRREQAAGPKPINLLPSEMVDDALARTASATGKWIRQNFSKIQWVIVAGLVGLGGYLLYTSQTEKKAAASASVLFSGVSAELGRVMAEDKRSDEEKEFDTGKVFKTNEERSEAALSGYRKAMADHPNTAVAQIAKLGEAGVLLDKHDWEGAIGAYSAVLASKLATADIDVKGRATEGLGLAKEGKGDLDGALASFKELEGIDARGYKELSLYQQGRILRAKGEPEKAKELLKQAREKLQAPGASEGGSLQYLQAAVDEELRRIDPSLVPARQSLGGPKGNSLSREELEKLMKQMQDAAQKKSGEEH